MKLTFDVFYRIEYVGMVELEVAEDRNLRAVVDKFRTLIEEGSVVFICLYDEPLTLATPRGNREIAGYAPDKKARIKAQGIEYECDHGAGGCLTMGAGNSQHFFLRDKFIHQPVGARGIGDALAQHFLDRRIAPRQSVAHDHQVRSGVQLRGSITGLNEHSLFL